MITKCLRLKIGIDEKESQKRSKSWKNDEPSGPQVNDVMLPMIFAVTIRSGIEDLFASNNGLSLA